MMQKPASHPDQASGRLVDSVIKQAHIRSYATSRQKHEHGQFHCPNRTLDDYNLIHVARGRPVWIIDGEPILLETEQLLVVPMGIPHEAHTGSTRRVTLLSLHVRFDLPGGRDVFEMLRPPRVRRIETGSRLDRYLSGALSEFDRDDYAQTGAAVDAWCELIVPELFRCDAAAGALAPLPADPLIRDLLDMLHTQIAIPTSLQDLVELSGYSAQHLNRVFRQALGATPLQYLHGLRMRHAAELVAAGDRTVESVARAVGFDDPFYFSRRFRETFGVSPSQYRA